MSAISGAKRVAAGTVGWSAAALLWGLAEATLFFIVPDVLLSYATLRRGVRPALLIAAWVVAGALLGGAIMYLWGRQDPSGATSVLERIPAIGTSLIGQVHAAMAEDWVSALFSGAFSGVPYKIFAVEAGRAGLDVGAFLAVSALARYARFAATILATALVRHGLARLGGERWSTAILAGFWVCFYALYFWVMAANP